MPWSRRLVSTCFGPWFHWAHPSRPFMGPILFVLVGTIPRSIRICVPNVVMIGPAVWPPILDRHTHTHRICIIYVGRNLWICAIHGSRCAIRGSILCTGIHGLPRNLWISIACAIYRYAGSAHRPAAYAASPRSPFEFVCIVITITPNNV